MPGRKAVRCIREAARGRDEAAATGRPVLYPNLAKNPTPYPFFGPRLREELGPLGALYALPLTLGRHVLGTAVCLRYGPLFLGPDQLAEAAEVAAAAAEAVADRCLPHLGATAELPWHPPALIDEHWTSTYRAAGAFAGVLEVPVHEALARLRARAFATGRPLPALARDILTHLTDGPDA
ncbi:hypothetical protein AB0B15_41320 [Streptomyces sp. NPDC045456]|uniref:hypothetical protein n=1 Tax=Streptomyces sp. NPDC045456 TaxID=3155254 RepID=UPI003408F777